MSSGELSIYMIECYVTSLRYHHSHDMLELIEWHKAHSNTPPQDILCACSRSQSLIYLRAKIIMLWGKLRDLIISDSMRLNNQCSRAQTDLFLSGDNNRHSVWAREQIISNSLPDQPSTCLLSSIKASPRVTDHRMNSFLHSERTGRILLPLLVTRPSYTYSCRRKNGGCNRPHARDRRTFRRHEYKLVSSLLY